MRLKPVLICFVTFVLFPPFVKAIAERSGPTIPLNFVVLTPNETAKLVLDHEFFEASVRRLNSAFKDSSGQQVVNFVLAAIHHHEAIAESDCPLILFGIHAEKPRRSEVYEAYADCDDDRIKSRKAINFYVVESTWESGLRWKNSSAFINWLRRPFVMVNWETFYSGYKVPDVHEMGHILGGLLHINACGSTDSTPTNVMAGLSEECEGTGGDRSLGFEDWQLRIVSMLAPIVHQSLN